MVVCVCAPETLESIGRSFTSFLEGSDTNRSYGKGWPGEGVRGGMDCILGSLVDPGRYQSSWGGLVLAVVTLYGHELHHHIGILLWLLLEGSKKRLCFYGQSPYRHQVVSSDRAKSMASSELTYPEHHYHHCEAARLWLAVYLYMSQQSDLPFKCCIHTGTRVIVGSFAASCTSTPGVHNAAAATNLFLRWFCY